jgi:hypothetical protein
MNSFTDIGQFRNVIRAVKSHHDYIGKDDNGDPIYNHVGTYPTLRFRGTVKLHGTNASFVKFADGHIEYQSRENVLTLQKDNASFMLAMSNIDVNQLFEGISFKEHCAIFGEWCGGNIQKGMAITSLPKMLVLFAVKIDNVYQDMENYKHLKMEDKRIFNILQFPHFYMDIDFEKPEVVQNEIVQLTIDVENQCPVGKYFGAEGIGEGIVWEHISDTIRYIFKVKGEKHSNSKVKKLATVDVEEIEDIKSFVEYAVTENRMLQGIEKLKEMHIPMDIKSTGEYLRWIVGDVIKEESDTIVANQINVKKLNGYISQRARPFWMNYLNSLEY